MRDQAPFWAAISTIIVWAAVAGIVVALLLLAELVMPWNVLAVIILAGMGMGGTITIWENIAKMRLAGAAPTAEQTPEQHRKLKRERQQRLSRLIESLDEDEAIELESLLMSQSVHDLE